MDVGTLQTPANAASMPGQKAGTPVPTPEVNHDSAQIRNAQIQAQAQIRAQVQSQEAKGKINPEEDAEKEKIVVEDTVESLNKFMDLMTADIRFTMHQKSQRLMVQLVSEKDQSVLREYPSSEFLDMIANIREFVGILTDKKA